MNFVLSYSFGKDSTLALHKMIEKGNTPIALLVMVNEDQQRSFFHGVDYNLMQKISSCLEIPLLLGKSSKGDYNSVMEFQLKKAKELGAETAVFGDIDISDHKTWADERCATASMETYFPLWHKNREEIVHEVIQLGYKALIKTINNEKLPKDILGKVIDNELLEVFKEYKIDLCGEYGEYHTLVVDGPLFKHKLEYTLQKIYDFDVTSVIDIV